MAPFNEALVKDKLAPFFHEKPEIIFAYLFGSLARGTAGKLSDIDLAIYVAPFCLSQSGGYGYQGDKIVELQALLKSKVDVVLLNTASTMLKFQVLKNGILIYCRSEKERRLFHEKTMAQYLDLKPLLKIQSYYLHKRLAEGVYGGGSGGWYCSGRAKNYMN